MRSLATTAALALLGGCATFGAKTTEIVTEPPGADIKVEGYGECTSPCVVEFDVPRWVSIAKAGFKPQRLELKPGKSRVVIPLELVAPTTDVEKTEMEKL